MERVLVTGGAGFVGSHIVERLLRDGARVRVFDNFSTGKRENLELGTGAGANGRLEVMEGDLRDRAAVERAAGGMDVIFHEAALASVDRSVAEPALVNAVNVEGTLHVLEAARRAGVRRVVFAGSSSVYGDAVELPKREDQRAVPVSPYGVSKLAGEEYLRVYHQVYGLETVTLRYFNVFGPRQAADSDYAAVIPIFISRLLKGEPPLIHGDGEQSRDFTPVEDVVEANVRAATAGPAAGRVFNVACGRRHTINELAARLIELSGAALEPTYTDPRPGDVRHSQADIAQARALLGFEPRAEFESGLRRTFEWFRARSGAAVR